MFNEILINKIQRTKLNIKHQHKTTMNAGDIIPLYVDEVLPGDTHKINMTTLARSMTPLAPTMDTAYIDTYAFFVPSRLVGEHGKEFMGENTEDAWAPKKVGQIPELFSDKEVEENSLGDYMGIPKIKLGTSKDQKAQAINALPVRAYHLIGDEWFRDQNLQKPINKKLLIGDEATNKTSGNIIMKANKYHDYFTSALPSPQKGDPIGLPIGGSAPVKGTGHMGEEIKTGIKNTTALYENSDVVSPQAAYSWPLYITSDEPLGPDAKPTRLSIGESVSERGTATIYKEDLIADLSKAIGVNVNELRMAFALQRMLEKDARGGTRYVEYLLAHFGVKSPDARQQRPEYLGGQHVPLEQTQVPQTSGTTKDGSPLGDVAAYGLTINSDYIVNKSFTEHGYLMIVGVIRTLHTYQQGIQRMFLRRDKVDFYDPTFANIGEQPILNAEIYAQNDIAKNAETFGFQEAWADYRYKANRTSAQMRSTNSKSLDIGHYGDNYQSLPMLNEDGIQETPVNIDRTLAVQTKSGAHQFLVDCYFENEAIRPMPTYSIPGLIDHN